ncbi:hypothetical protein Gotur_017854 [Gossypium turneri]
MILVVLEIYASFRDQESRRPYDAIWETKTVRGKEEDKGNDDKEDEKEEKDMEHDSQEDDDGYKVIFQSQRSMQKG